MRASDKEISKRIDNLIDTLKDFGIDKKSISLSIRNLILLKESAIKPGGLVDGKRTSFGYEEISKSIEENIIGSAKFEHFDCDMYVENVVGDIENQEGYSLDELEELFHEPIRKFIGNCFYKEAIDNGLYDIMPDIIKDKSVIKKETLEARMKNSMSLLPESLRPKFELIKESISTSKNPFFLFLYDRSLSSVTVSWKYVLHDTIHILKDYRIEDIINPNNITNEGDEIYVAGNHLFPDSFSYFQIFKRILEGPIKSNITNYVSFNPSEIALRADLLNKVLEYKNIPKKYGDEGFDSKIIGAEKRILMQNIKNFKSGFDKNKLIKNILFIIIKECLILSESGEKVDLLSDQDSTDRRTDLFLYHIFFGNITLSLDNLNSDEIKSKLYDKVTESLLYLIDNLNNFYQKDAESSDVIISKSDIEEYSKYIIDNFIKSKSALIKNRIDLGFREYSAFASKVESIFESSGENYTLKKDMSEYPNVSIEDYTEGLTKNKDLFLGTESPVGQSQSYEDKINFLQSLIRSNNVFKDRMIQLTKDDEGNFYNPDKYVYAFIRI